MNKTEKTVNAISFEIIGGKNVMPIGAFVGPFSPNDSDKIEYPEFVNEEFFIKCKECGLNLFVYPHEYFNAAPESADKALRLCEKYRIGYFAMHSYFTEVLTGAADFDPKKFRTILQKFSDYPACVGIHTKDEPQTPYFAKMGVLNDAFYEYAPEGMHTYANLYPKYYWNVPYDGKKEDNCSYEEYVDRFIKEVRPKFLSYDHYVYETYNDSYRTNAEDYFQNLSVVRRKAEENGMPFWCFVQAGGHWNDLGKEIPVIVHFPEKGEFFWNVSTQLAYGAKGIQYFPLIQDVKYAVSEGGVRDYARNGFFGADGSTNQWYYYAKEINPHIRSVGEVLMNSVSEGVIACGRAVSEVGTGSEVIASGKYGELEGVSGDAVVGCFDYLGGTAFYVANGLRKEAGAVTLTFGREVCCRITQGTETRVEKGGRIVLNLDAGEGVLLVIK